MVKLNARGIRLWGARAAIVAAAIAGGSFAITAYGNGSPPTETVAADAADESSTAADAMARADLMEPEAVDGDGGTESMSGDEGGSSNHEHEHATTGVVTTDGTAPKEHRPPADPTADEKACMASLTAEVKEATLRLADPAVAEAEGYRFSDDPTHTHMPNRAYARDGLTLDYAHPESAIYRMRDDGTYRLVGVLFKAKKNEGPMPCGNATWWHTHTNCVDDATGKPLDLMADVDCPPGSTPHEGAVEMMHVWFVPRRQS
jgi:hypothetical protein